MLNSEALQKFETIVGRSRLKTSQEDLLTYGYDAYILEFLPEAVLFPKSTEEVSAIMKVASAHQISVTPRGAGSGLSGASLAKKGGIILCFTMMNQILEINAANRYAVVQAGVIISELQKEVEKIGLFYPPDPRKPLPGCPQRHASGVRRAALEQAVLPLYREGLAAGRSGAAAATGGAGSGS